MALELSEYVRESVQGEPRIREQIHVYRQTLQDHSIALSGWKPSLDLSTSVGRISQRTPTSSDFETSQVDVTLTQNLFNGFDTTNQVNQAKSRVSAAVYQLYDTADNIALDAAKAYLDVLSQWKLVTLAEENVAAHERILSQIVDQSHGGIGRRSEIEQTEGRLASAEASLISQQNNLQDALIQAHKVLGRYLQPEEFAEPSIPPLPVGEIEGLIDEALANHPALESARQNIEASRFDYHRSRRTHLPQLNLQLQHSARDNVGGFVGPRTDNSLLLNLKYNLYRGGADVAERKKKYSAWYEMEAFRSRVRRQVIDTMRLSWTADRALNEQLPFLRLHVKKAREALGLYHEEFFLNKRDLIDVLDAESELNTARKRETESYYEAIAARFRIYEALGRLFDSLGLEVDASEDDFRIANLSARDSSLVDTDRDMDQDLRLADKDQCDNSRRGNTVDEFGCETKLVARFGYLIPNKVPIAVNDAFFTEFGTALNIPPDKVLNNDSDPDGDQLSITDFSNPVTGTLMQDADGYLIYAPKDGFTGTDEFSYTVSDDGGATARAKVAISVGSKPIEKKVLRFVYKKPTLTPESLEAFESVIALLERSENTGAEIRVFTDNIGSRHYNLMLSEQRAQALRGMFVAKGIEEKRIRTLAMGELSPIGDNTTDAGRAENRRAEISFFKTTLRPIEAKIIARNSTWVHRNTEPHTADTFRSAYISSRLDNSANESAGVIQPHPSTTQTVENLRFSYKKQELTSSSMAHLEIYAEQLRRFPRATVEIRAYTDNVGSERYNRELSRRRAEWIKGLLLEREIDENRIQAYGMGEANPVADNATESGRALNRRAELKLIIGEQY